MLFVYDRACLRRVCHRATPETGGNHSDIHLPPLSRVPGFIVPWIKCGWSNGLSQTFMELPASFAWHLCGWDAAQYAGHLHALVAFRRMHATFAIQHNLMCMK
jgi:hypothetical protein